MQATCLYLQIALGGTQKLEEHIARNLVSLEQDCTRFHKADYDDRGAIITCQTYIENMSTVLKPEEIAFGVLFFFFGKNCGGYGHFEIIAQGSLLVAQIFHFLWTLVYLGSDLWIQVSLTHRGFARYKLYKL